MYSLLRRWLFSKDAETAHHLTFRMFKAACAVPGFKSLLSRMQQVEHESLPVEAFGLRFPNPVGLAAGLDKNATMVDEFAALGFGFVEVGTLTPKPQSGNDKPRLFRLLSDQAIINRMGFNNDGVDAAVLRLAKRRSRIIVGGNIGKNKVTTDEGAVDDYLTAFRSLFDAVDYFVVNVSSPNTPGLRSLQDREPLERLLSALQIENQAIATRPDNPAARKPILLKIAPDLTDGQLDDIIATVHSTGIAGIIATNTTISRDGLTTPADKVQNCGAGGLSGRPLTRRSTEVIRYLAQRSNGEIPIVGVGGIHSPQDAIEKLDAGATLIQLYTGLVYEGPRLVPRILNEIVRRRKTWSAEA